MTGKACAVSSAVPEPNQGTRALLSDPRLYTPVKGMLCGTLERVGLRDARRSRMFLLPHCDGLGVRILKLAPQVLSRGETAMRYPPRSNIVAWALNRMRIPRTGRGLLFIGVALVLWVLYLVREMPVVTHCASAKSR